MIFVKSVNSFFIDQLIRFIVETREHLNAIEMIGF